MHIDLRRTPPQRPRREQRNRYGSEAAVRSRLLMLVGLLILIFFLMGEARKPENYHWLTKLQGGSQATKAPAKTAPRPAVVQPETGTKVMDITDTMPNRPSATPRPTVPNPTAPRSRSTNSTSERNQELSAGPLGELPTSLATSAGPSSPWLPLLNGLSGDERATLFRLLRTTNQAEVTQAPTNSEPASLAISTALLGKLNSQVNDLFADQLDRGGGVGNDNTEQTRQTAAVVEFKSKWDAELFPALQAVSAGDPLNELQSNYLKAAREEIFRQSITLLQDATEVARPADSLAWLLAWQQLLHAPLGGTTAVTPYELMTQPKQFRGRAVSFSGTLRGIETAAANEQELGLSQYYVLWIQPKELDRTPYCVYAAELPLELRPQGEKFELSKQPVTVRGLFWKVRTYVDTTKAVSTCPLVLARNVVLTAQPIAAEPYRWKPPAWLLWTVGLLLPVVALGIAWRIYRTGREFMLPRSPGRTRLILDSLEELGADKSIQSAREGLAQLEAKRENQGEKV